MVIIHYDINNILTVIESDIFISDYNKLYKQNKKNEDIKLFLETIKKNKNYYRLNINPLPNIDESIDINTIKCITNNINKISNTNKDIIFKEILDILDNIKLANIVINILIDLIIINTNFSDLYIELLKKIIEKYDVNLNNLIDKFHKLLYRDYKDTEVNNYYNLLCEKNKCTDNSIGYSTLVVKLENNNLIKDKVNKLINELLDKFDINNEEDLYKYILCIYNIVKIQNIKETEICIKIKNKLEDITTNIQNKKIKFKIMDINDILNN